MLLKSALIIRMTDFSVPKALQAVNEHFIALTANVKHLTAESAGLYRVFEVAMQLAASKDDWTPAQREQLVLAVKACNNAPHTAKAIRDVESAGMEILRQEMEKQVKQGISAVYQPGINLCLGLAEGLAYHHRSMARK